MTGKVWLVGAGPGDPGLLTLRAARTLAHADALVYDYLAAAPIVALAPPDCERIYVGKKAGAHAMPQAEIDALLVRLGQAGKRVVRLKGGDPFVFGRGGEEAEALARAGVPFEIVPGITSAIAAPAYAGIPVTHRDFNTAVTIATGHEDPTKGSSTLDWERLSDPHQTLVLLMVMGNLGAVTEQLLAHGRAPETPVAVIREGTKPAQQTLVATLGTVVDAVAEAQLGPPAVVVIGDVVRMRDSIAWFDRGPLFGRRVLVTRPAGQADEFAAQLWERGAEPLLAPTIAIEPPDDPGPAAEAVAHIRDYAWVLFTSRNGVTAFFDGLARNRRDLRALGDTQIAAIGPRTAQALAARGARVDFIPQTSISEELAQGLLERTLEGERLLLFRAQEARDVLPWMLAERGRAVEVVAAYKTRFADDPGFAAKVAAADVLTFTSASTVRGYGRLLGARAVPAASGKLVACIGPVTAEAARELGLRVDVAAREYTVDGLLDALGAAEVSRPSA